MQASWLATANQPGCDFPLANLPWGIFDSHGKPHLGVAIGDQILDLHAAMRAAVLGGLPDAVLAACLAEDLLPLMRLAPADRAQLRAHLTSLLEAGGEGARTASGLLRPQAGAVMHLPARIGDYTDFYASEFHARNVGSLFRPDNPLLPNYKYVPVAYHGRSSSVVVSGTEVRRPWGQLPGSDGNPPTFAPSRQLDYEAEIGLWIAGENTLGQPVPIAAAGDRIFGVCLLNDWSARDIQRWEYQPLGPFLGKNFSTSVSPWIVPIEALAPYRVPAFQRPAGDPAPLSYFADPTDLRHGALDIVIECYLSSRAMREQGLESLRMSQGRMKDLYWTPAQMVTHHTSNGCNLRAGDLFGTGTISGPNKSARGCLLELAWRGQEPVHLPNGEQRAFLEDGDEVILRGYCQAPKLPRIGLGECRSIIQPATPLTV